MLRIDAHHHVWDLSVRDQPWTENLAVLRRSFDVHELAPELARNSIDATVVVQTIATPDETPELLQLASETSFVAGVVGWIDLEARDAEDRLARLRELSGGDALVGIRHQVQSEPDPAWLERESVQRGLSAVGRAGLAYDLLVTPDQLPAAVNAVRRNPEVRFILDHGGKPRIASSQFEPWAALIRSLAASPNVSVKLSGLTTEAGSPWSLTQLHPYVDALIGAFGPERMMFGSDWPVSLLAASYSRTAEAAGQLIAGLTRDEQDAVFGGNALRWYQLPQASGS